MAELFTTETPSGVWVAGSLVGDDRFFITEGHLDLFGFVEVLTVFAAGTDEFGFGDDFDSYFAWVESIIEDHEHAYATVHEGPDDEQIVSWSKSETMIPVTVLAVK